MKTLYLIANRLRQYANKNRIIFCLFILGGILNAIVFAYTYGNLLPAIVNRNSEEFYYRQYFVYLDNNPIDVWPSNAVDSITRSDFVESVSVASEIDRTTTVVASAKGPKNIVYVEGNINEICTGQAVVPFDNAVNENKIYLFGREYTIVGRHTGTEYYISLEDYQDAKLTTNQIIVTAKNRQSKANDQILSLLNEQFKNEYIKTPYIYENADQRGSSAELFMICCVFAVVMISFMFLLTYLIDQNADENITSIIVGAPKSAILTLIYWEGLILSAVSYLVGLLIHHATWGPLFSKINVSDSIEYHLSDYLTMFLLMFVITIIVLTPFLKKYSKMTPIEVKLRHM